jgi:hypothetical protein
MKDRTRLLNSLAACSLLCLVAAGCSKSEKAPDASAVAVVTPAPPLPAPAVRPIVAVPAVASPQVQEGASWATIKDLTFDQKSAFVAGATGLESTLTGQVDALRAKRAAVPSTTDMKDWDFQMNDLVTSQAYLKATVEEAGAATPDTWQQEKDKVDQAWQKAEDAYDKVRTSTTL